MSDVVIWGAGWLGGPLLEVLNNKGIQAIGVTRTEESAQALNNKKLLAQAFNAMALSDFDQAAWQTYKNAKVWFILIPPRLRTSPQGEYVLLLNRLKQALLHFNVEHCIMASSTSVYPDVAQEFTEDYVFSAQEKSTNELIQAEQVLLDQNQCKITILRFAGLSGGSRMLAKHFAGKTNLSQGSAPVNLVHLNDAVASLMFVYEHRLTGIFNVCSSLHPLKRDFYTQLAQQFDLSLPQFIQEHAGGKQIANQKLKNAGFAYQFNDPALFTYTV
jgi:nucleoside-diphosphate-sugar epimerase